MPKTEYVEVDVESVTRTTEMAALLTVDGEEHWTPLSVIEDNGEIIDEDFSGILHVAKWYCDREGMLY